MSRPSNMVSDQKLNIVKMNSQPAMPQQKVGGAKPMTLKLGQIQFSDNFVKQK